MGFNSVFKGLNIIYNWLFYLTEKMEDLVFWECLSYYIKSRQEMSCSVHSVISLSQHKRNWAKNIKEGCGQNRTWVLENLIHE